jgi:hypothetical protein
MFFKKKKGGLKESLIIRDHPLIERISREPGFPWFISFPRTGSHWLRMVMELYFKKPSLVEVFYTEQPKEYTCYHRHDLKLTIGGCSKVLYLYREPVNTIFSYLKYEKKIISKENVVNYTNCYIDHLIKWLLEENFTKDKLVLKFEKLRNRDSKEFKKLCTFFDEDFDEERMNQCMDQVTKKKLYALSKHDLKVVDPSAEYEKERLRFDSEYRLLIEEQVVEKSELLKPFFGYL